MAELDGVAGADALAVGAAAAIERDVLSVWGDDAGTYLQGQLSQDVTGLAVGASAWSWVLQPAGKVDALVRVTRVEGDRWLLDTDGGFGGALEARIRRFRLRSRVEVEALAWKALAVRGRELDPLDPPAGGVAVQALWSLPTAGDTDPTVTDLPVTDLPVTDPAATDLPVTDSAVTDLSVTGASVAVDLLGPDPQVPPGMAIVTAAAFEVARIAAGVPKMGAELTEATIPAETGLVGLTVSFTKGCYTGQELVARIDSRGSNVPRHLCVLALDGPAEPGALLTIPQANDREVPAGGDGEKLAPPRKAGFLTSVAQDPRGGWVALGYVGRAAIPGSAVTVEGGATAVVPVPLRTGGAPPPTGPAAGRLPAEGSPPAGGLPGG